MAYDDVLGINRRNIDYIMPLNKREHFVYVDDKLVTKQVLVANNIPCATVHGSTDSFFGIAPFLAMLSHVPRFALKPARGSGGSGILVVRDNHENRWLLSDGVRLNRAQQQEHVENILYGTFSLDSSGDTAFAEELIETHPDLLYFTTLGLPDARIILHCGRPVLSMLRVPTRQSHGKANLHAGGFAVAVDLTTGISGDGWFRGRRITVHPETGVTLAGQRIPFWREMVEISRQLFALFPLGYMGVDFAVDGDRGPLILELNARPGLEIQNVTSRGLRPILAGEVYHA
jgi:alpha-L-glutamate ligase-like protein